MSQKKTGKQLSKINYGVLIFFTFLCFTHLLHGQAVSVNPAVQYQTFEGWGVSICWWGNQVGRWSEQNRNELVEYVINPETGLGYNIYRFNIGGGENPSHNHMTQFRDMPGYQPSRGAWDWDADIYQQRILQRLMERGNAMGENMIIEAFSNSPPYWMTISGCASGANSSGNNLAESNYQAFADYLLDVVQYYRDNLGITFRTLEPLNEPAAEWWVAGNTQEGCTFRSETQSGIIEVVGRSLAARGLTGTTISAPDETSIDTTINSLKMYTDNALSYVSQINTHSYSGSRRTELKNLAAGLGKKLWQSESGPLSWPGGDNNDVAIYMAGKIILDLREMQPAAWLDWQVVDGGVWGTIHVDQNSQTFSLTKRFYMHRNFSRFIRPGAVFIDINNSNMIAAISPGQDNLIIVVLNSNKGNGNSYTIDLSAFTTTGNSAEVYRTSVNENLAGLPDVPVSGGSFTANVPAYSITTYTIPISGSSIPSPTPEPGPNLATGKTATADSEESGNGNYAGNGNDGSLTTRWCANDGTTGHWWQVDLGELYNIAGTEVYWEENRVYQYIIEASSDNSTWEKVADRRGNTAATRNQADLFSTQARYIRITVTGLETEMWASFYEFKVFEDPGPAPTPATGTLGDVNGDSRVTIVDALMTAQFYVGLDPSPFQQGNADVNCDNSINIVDALIIAQKYVGLIAEFSCSP